MNLIFLSVKFCKGLCDADREKCNLKSERRSALKLNF